MQRHASHAIASKRYRPNEFRAEFIKYSYQQIIKKKELEEKAENDKGLMKSILKEFSNQAVDDPYKDRKTSKGNKMESGTVLLAKKVAPKVLKAVKPLQVDGLPNGKTPYFGQTSSELKKSIGSTATGIIKASNKRKTDHKLDLNFT